MKSGEEAGEAESVMKGVASEMFQPGAVAPEFELESLAGEKVTLKSFRGKVVLVNFWATWCVPCVAEMPALERLYKSLKDKGVVVLAINTDASENKEAVRKFVADKGLSFPVLMDPELEVAGKYGVSGFPETMLVGKDGLLKALKVPGEKTPIVRVIADQPWDSPAFIKAVSEILDTK